MDSQLLKLHDLILQGGDLPTLLEHDYPLIISDYQSVTDFIYSDMSDSDKVQAIIEAYEVKEYLEANRPHDNKHILNPYKVYLDIHKHENELVCKKTFSTLLNAISVITLNNKILTFSGKTNEIFDILSRLGLSQTDSFNFIRDVRSGNNTQYITNLCNTSMNDSNLNAYVKKAILGINHEHMIMIDALCLITHAGEESDDILECKFILNKVIDICIKSNPKHIFFINANPYFIRSVMEKPFFKSYYISFSMENDEYAEVFQKHYLNSNATFTNIHNLLSHIYENDKYPDVTVVFGNRSEELYKNTIETLSILINSALGIHTLMVFDSDYHIKNTNAELHKILVESELQSIDLIPDSIPSLTFPKRKAIIQCRYGFLKEYSHNIVLRHFSHIDQNGFPAISYKSFTTTLTYDEFNDDSITLRQKFRKDKILHEIKTPTKLNQPSPYFFSPEICFFVNISGQGTNTSPYRVSAYARYPHDSNKRSSKIVLSAASTKVYSIPEIEKWTTECYPFIKTKKENGTSSVRRVISDIYKVFYKSKPISLKTLIYIYEEFENAQPSEVLTEIHDWMYSPLAEYRTDLISEILLDEFLTNQYIKGKQAISYRQALELFKRLFDIAIRNSHCHFNPAKSLLTKTFISNEDIYDINAALKRKMLYPNEIKRILNKYHSLYTSSKRPLAIALYIQFLLGLEPNIVCALQWADFCRYECDGTVFYAILIRRQLNTEGTKFLQFSRREHYRIIPLPKFVSDILIIEKQYQREYIAQWNEEYLLSCSIITGDDHIINGQTKVMAPKTMYKEGSKIIKTLKDPDITLTVPTDNEGTTETNLSYYGADLFRQNIRHYNCFDGETEQRIMSKGEYCYISGLKGPDTFSRNYCDYGNVKSLKILYKKMEKLTRRLIK